MLVSDVALFQHNIHIYLQYACILQYNVIHLQYKCFGYGTVNNINKGG